MLPQCAAGAGGILGAYMEIPGQEQLLWDYDCACVLCTLNPAFHNVMVFLSVKCTDKWSMFVGKIEKKTPELTPELIIRFKLVISIPCNSEHKLYLYVSRPRQVSKSFR